MIVFAVLLFACFTYAFARGGRSERVAASALVAGSLLTLAVGSPLPVRFADVERSILLVDIGVLLAFAWVALRRDRIWIIWVLALQLLVVVAHLARLADPEMLRRGYGILLAGWSYPQLLLIALGTRNHWRRKIRRDRASDTSSPFSIASAPDRKAPPSS